jgi:hypothetical protein
MNSSSESKKLLEELAGLKRRLERLEALTTPRSLTRPAEAASAVSTPPARVDDDAALESAARWREERVRALIEPTQHPPIWEAIRASLERRLEPSTFCAWFSAIRLVADDGDRLTIEVGDQMSAQWIPHRYADVLQEALAEAGRPGAAVAIVIAESPWH